MNELEELRFSHEDPKITKLVELISDIRANDHIPLIFSRFTDTTEAIEMSLWDHFPELCIGRYDGQIQRIKHPSNHSNLNRSRKIYWLANYKPQRLTLLSVQMLLLKDSISKPHLR